MAIEIASSITTHAKLIPPSFSTSPRTKRTPSKTMPAFNQNSYVATPARKILDTDGVGYDQSENDRPEDVFDIGKDQMVGFAIARDELLDEFARIADGGEEQDSGDEAKEVIEKAR